jgi:acylphosphatase
MSQDQHMAVRVVISGRVQGVWYRNWTVGEAEARGVDGWVRNRADRTVEALFSGPEARVREMINVCHDGPPLAKVDGVTEYPEPALEAGAGFKQRSSA